MMPHASIGRVYSSHQILATIVIIIGLIVIIVSIIIDSVIAHYSTLPNTRAGGQDDVS